MITLKELLAKSQEKLDTLHPKMKKYVIVWIERCYKRGVLVLIIDAYRDKERQELYFKQGKSKAHFGESYHNYRLAVDFAILDIKTGKTPLWDTKIDQDKDRVADWSECVIEAKRLKFEWAGDWKNFKEECHIQMTFGLSIADLKAGKLKNIK